MEVQAATWCQHPEKHFDGATCWVGLARKHSIWRAAACSYIAIRLAFNHTHKHAAVTSTGAHAPAAAFAMWGPPL